MRTALRLIGTLLLLVSLLGLAGVALAPVVPESVTLPLPDVGLPLHSAQPASTTVTLPRPASADDAAAAARPITRLVIPRIDLAADVVPATLVERDGGATWQVPAFKVGHAEGTAGAGQPGNAVLLGHVTSVHSGNVFATLDQTTPGDQVQIFSDTDEFDYQVASVDHVPRTDTDVLAQGPTPTISLITCTGVWLPTIWDYTERLVVRAELIGHT
jgi:LPXTG-site transpeptidase (sortase) family protein